MSIPHVRRSRHEEPVGFDLAMLNCEVQQFCASIREARITAITFYVHDNHVDVSYEIGSCIKQSKEAFDLRYHGNLSSFEESSRRLFSDILTVYRYKIKIYCNFD